MSLCHILVVLGWQSHTASKAEAHDFQIKSSDGCIVHVVQGGSAPWC